MTPLVLPNIRKQVWRDFVEVKAPSEGPRKKPPPSSGMFGMRQRKTAVTGEAKVSTAVARLG